MRIYMVAINGLMATLNVASFALTGSLVSLALIPLGVGLAYYYWRQS